MRPLVVPGPLHVDKHIYLHFAQHESEGVLNNTTILVGQRGLKLQHLSEAQGEAEHAKHLRNTCDTLAKLETKRARCHGAPRAMPSSLLGGLLAQCPKTQRAQQALWHNGNTGKSKGQVWRISGVPSAAHLRPCTTATSKRITCQQGASLRPRKHFNTIQLSMIFLHQVGHSLRAGGESTRTESKRCKKGKKRFKQLPTSGSIVEAVA